MSLLCIFKHKYFYTKRKDSTEILNMVLAQLEVPELHPEDKVTLSRFTTEVSSFDCLVKRTGRVYSERWFREGVCERCNKPILEIDFVMKKIHQAIFKKIKTLLYERIMKEKYSKLLTKIKSKKY